MSIHLFRVTCKVVEMDNEEVAEARLDSTSNLKIKH
jgi:hypothetical protein